MSDALRSLLASFVIEVDRAGELAKGNAGVDALKKKLVELQLSAAPAAAAVKDVFQAASGNLNSFLAQQNAKQFGGRADNTGFGAAGAAAATRNAAAATAQANAAAVAYAGTLRGRLAGAVGAVRAAFTGAGTGVGTGAKGSGLIGTLATARNGFLALGAGLVVNRVKHLVDGIGDISEGAARLGVTTDEFQRMSTWAKQNATDVDTLGTAFRTLATSAVDPSKESAAAFAQLGVATKDSSGQFKTSQELFFETGEALAGVTNETVRTQLAQKLLGRSAIALKPMFAQGTEAFKKQREEMLKLKVLSPEVIAAADGLSDSWVVLSTQLLAAAGPVLEDVLFPALKALTGFLVKGVDVVAKWGKNTHLASVVVVALAFAVQARLLPALASVFTKGIAASGSLGKFAASGAKAAFSFARLALGLLVLQDFLTFLSGGKSETGDLIEKIFGKKGVAVTLKAVADLKAAMVDLWNWVTGAGNGEGIARLWQEFGNGITVMINDLLHSVGIGKGGTDGPFSLSERITGGPSTIPAGGAGASRQGSTTIVGDTTVAITMGQSATAPDVGRAVVAGVEAERDALIAPYPGI